MQGAETGAAEGNGGLVPVSFSAISGWTQQSPAAILTGLRSFERGCGVIEVMPEDQKLGGAGLTAGLAGQAGQWRAACMAARTVPPGDAGAAAGFFETYFAPYQVAVRTRFSGYFEPVYDGSEKRRPGYDVPVYGHPHDLVSVAAATFGDEAAKPVIGRIRYQKLVPYYTRAEIGDGAIGGSAPVVAWLTSPVDDYMMQVQGSGRLRLPDGKMIELGFDGTNGRPYTPIGKLMVAKHLLPPGDVTPQSISAWLGAHPEQAAPLMEANENYVFFKQVYDIPEDLGAPGALGVPLTPGASIAVAGKAIPLGTPVFASLDGGSALGRVGRLMVAQDIDTSAQGFEAADIFTGIGRAGATDAASIARAAAASATDRRPGRLYVLLPRPVHQAPASSPLPPRSTLAAKAMP